MDDESDQSPDDRSYADLLYAVLPGAGVIWSDLDLAQILAHQLDSPLIVSADRAATVSDATADQPCESVTFGSVLRSASPPLELLRKVKAIAKVDQELADSTEPALAESALPEEVATALYYAAEAAAAVRLGVRLSGLPPETLAKGFRWLASRAFVPEELRRLGQEAAQGSRQSSNEASRND